MKIAILTSGGDAPGMNAAVRSATRSALNYGYKVYGILDGYKGLLEKKFIELDQRFVSGFLSKGGTDLGTARSDEFANIEYKKIAASILKEYEIDYLICIGGDGSANGAFKLSEFGVNVIVIPATIDNDFNETDYAIGFHTALDTITKSIDRIRDTSSSHNRCSIIEVMGRSCGELAIFAGICTGAEVVITKNDNPLDKEKLFKDISFWQKQGRRHVIIIITEHITNVHELAKEIEINTSFSSRATILGHVQRGGSPVPFDRVLATEFGAYAINLIKEKIKNVCVVLSNNKITHKQFDKIKNAKRKNLKDKFNLLKQTT